MNNSEQIMNNSGGKNTELIKKLLCVQHQLKALHGLRHLNCTKNCVAGGGGLLLSLTFREENPSLQKLCELITSSLLRGRSGLECNYPATIHPSVFPFFLNDCCYFNYLFAYQHPIKTMWCKLQKKHKISLKRLPLTPGFLPT